MAAAKPLRTKEENHKRVACAPLLRFSPFEIPFPYLPPGFALLGLVYSVFCSRQNQLLVIKARLATGVKERGLQKGENSRGTPLVVSTFCLTKVEMPMKHDSGY